MCIRDRDNLKELSLVNTLEGCCGVKLFAGSSTGNLLVSKEKDIEKVISNSSKIISVHSEDENILLSRKKFIKDIVLPKKVNKERRKKILSEGIIETWRIDQEERKVKEARKIAKETYKKIRSSKDKDDG